MVLKPEVLDAFTVLGITPDVDQPTATKTYKRLALIHHPDRNHGDATATQRFQQIGAAWNICQRHFDNPSWSHIPEPSSDKGSRHPQGFNYHFTADDDIPLDEDELYEFYMFMFAETLFGRYSRTKGQRYRYQRSGAAGAGLSTFSGGFAESQERQARNNERQRREQEEYEKRKRELELEIEEEEREREKIARKLKADDDRRTTALEHAFQAASTGNSAGVQKSVLDYDLDVNAPRKRLKHARKQDDVVLHDTLLHVAARHCDETLVMYLIEKGANPNALNQDHLTPFHSAIKAGNVRVVRFIMERRGKSFDGYHPSKAALSGRTPLQLAVDSGASGMVELVVKHATTHDVERCWKSDKISEETKEILRRKKGFLPPEEISNPDATAPSSKKHSRQQELAQQKELRIAEELERARINRQKKEERAARRAEKDREQQAFHLAKEATRQQKEMEERQQLEDNSRAQEAEFRAKELQAARLKTEASARAEAESRAEAEAELRIKAEAESRAKVEADMCATAEAESRTKAIQGRHLNDQRAAQVRETQQPLKRTQKELTAQTADSAPTSSSTVVAPKPPSSSKNLLSETERQELRRAKLKEKRKAKQIQRRLEREQTKETETSNTHDVPTILPQVDPATSKAKTKKEKSRHAPIRDTEVADEAQKATHEANLRRRQEQSARDRERHRQMLEDRVKFRAKKDKPTEYVPLTPVSTQTTRKNTPERATTSTSSSHRQNDMSTLSIPPHDNPLPYLLPEEDIQTCIVPEDLFMDERPMGGPKVMHTEKGAKSSLIFGSESAKVGNIARSDGLGQGSSKRSYGSPYWRGRSSK